MSSSVATVTVTLARIAAVVEALSYASVDEFERSREAIPLGQEDGFADVEGALCVFLEELQQAKQALREALARQERVNAELEEKLRTIELQRDAIRQLSTPILEVSAGVLCLPVVGVVDSQRSMEMTEALLESIVKLQGRVAVVDITGIEVMDTKTADHFIKMAKAVRLLGAECVVTGINPNIAQTLTHIGVELNGVRTMRSLKDALEAVSGAAAKA